MDREESVEELTEQLEALQLVEASIRRRLSRARAREQRRQQQLQLRVGARIEVTNPITTADGTLATEANDRRAFITRITLTQVHFRTLNGHETWRARRNIRLVPDDEVWGP
jgi:hypothetical protein